MTKKKRSTRKTKTKRKKTSSKRRRRPALASVELRDLQRELDRRKTRLESQREKLVADLEDVENQLSQLNGSRSRSAQGRSRSGRQGKATLADALHKLLNGKTLSVSEAAAEVKKVHRSKSSNLRNMVNQTLLADERFKRVARGRYTAK